MDSDSSFFELMRDRSVLLCGRRTPARRISGGHYRSETPSFDVYLRGDLALFLARNATDRSRSLKAWLMASSWESRDDVGGPVGRRYPAPTTLHNFTRQRNGLNAAYRSLLQQESSFGATTMDAFRIHFRGLIAGGLATALLSLPIHKRPARLTAESSARRLPVAQAEEHGS